MDITVAATNTGDIALEDLSLGLVLGTAARTRGDEQLAMSTDTVLTPLFPDVRPQEGTLEPGRTRSFEASIDLTAAGVSQIESLIYPLSVDLRSGDTVVAELRTPVLFFFQTPLHPLSFAWTVELAPPITFGPDGSFADDSIEREVAPGGRIAAQVAMLHELAAAGTPVNVALSPVLITTLQRMSGGYRIGDRLVPQGEGGSADAQRLMASLRDSLGAPTADVFVYPFSAPQLPAMLRSGLGRDLDLQIDRGRDLVSSALGFTPSSASARAPDGQLDRSAIQRLAADGATTLLVDAGTVDRPAQLQDFTVLPTAALDGPGRRGSDRPGAARPRRPGPARVRAAPHRPGARRAAGPRPARDHLAGGAEHSPGHRREPHRRPRPARPVLGGVRAAGLHRTAPRSGDGRGARVPRAPDVYGRAAGAVDRLLHGGLRDRDPPGAPTDRDAGLAAAGRHGRCRPAHAGPAVRRGGGLRCRPHLRTDVDRRGARSHGGRIHANPAHARSGVHAGVGQHEDPAADAGQRRPAAARSRSSWSPPSCGSPRAPSGRSRSTATTRSSRSPCRRPGPGRAPCACACGRRTGAN